MAPDAAGIRAVTAGSPPPPAAPPAWLDLRMAAVLAGLLLFLWSGVFDLYPTTGWVDPGLYIYWMLRPFENATLRGVDYHAARLGFILPGALAYRLFDVVTAHVVLTGGFYLMGLVAVLMIAAGTLHGFAARALVLVVIGSNVLWTSAFTRGYTDGPAMAYGLLALALLLGPARPPGAGRHAWAGALLILAFCAHPVGGGIAGFTAIFVGLARAVSLRAVVVNGAAAVLGALGCLVLLGGIAAWLGMPFLFLRSLLPTVDLAMAGAYELFFVSWREWMPQAPRVMLLPVILLMLALGLRGLWPLRRQRLALFLAAVMPLVALGAWLLRSTSMAQTSYYASYLILSLVPALVLFLHRLEQLSLAPRLRHLAGWVAVLLLATALGAWLPFGLRAGEAFAIATWGAVGAVFLLGLVAVLWRRPMAAVAMLSLTIALAGSLNGDTGRGFNLRDTADQRASQTVLMELHRFLNEPEPLSGPYHIWMNRDGFTAERGLRPGDLFPLKVGPTTLRMNLLDTLAASLGWHLTAMGFHMPRTEAEPERLATLKGLTTTPATFIGFCAAPAECAQGLAMLEEMGLRVSAPRSRTIAVPGAPGVTVVKARIAALAPPDQPVREVLEAALGRVLRAEAAAERTGRDFQNGTGRAVWQDAEWPPAIAIPPGLLDHACVSGHRLRNCWLRHAGEDNVVTIRHLRFDRHGHAWRLISASGPDAAWMADDLAAFVPGIRQAAMEVAAGAEHLILWHGEGGDPGMATIRPADIYDLAIGFAHAARLAQRAPPMRISSFGETMPRAYRQMPGWQLATGIVEQEFRAMVLCALPRECEDGLLALRELGMSVQPGMRRDVAARGLPPLTIATARVLAPPPVDEPGPAQLGAVLERALRLDAWEAQSGTREANVAQRAMMIEPHWPDPAQPAPPLLQTSCAPGPGIRDCRVRYEAADGRVVERMFGFRRSGKLWWNTYDVPPPP